MFFSKGDNKKNISLSVQDKIAVISNFSTLLTAGISILEAVDSLLEDSKGNQKKLLMALREDLIQGKHVYASFSQFPKVFDRVTINILKAAEEAGTLDITLIDLRKNIQKEMEFADKVRSALVYPTLISVVFLGVLLVILVIVIPKISTVFTRLRVELPLPTKILIFTSDLLLKNTIPLLLGLALAVGGLIFIYQSKRSFFLNMFFKLPVVSTLVKQIDLTRFSRSMFLLLNSGITITNALDLTQDVVMRKDVKNMIKKTQEMVLGGKRISEGMRNAGHIMPPLLIKIVEAGEKTGSLDKSMADIAEYLDYQVSRTLATLTAILEPAMLVLMGIFVGGMMMAIIAPIYGLMGQIGPQ